MELNAQKVNKEVYDIVNKYIKINWLVRANKNYNY